MTETQAMIGYSSKFQVADVVDSSPLNLVDLEEILKITPPNPEVEQIDATHSQSPDRRKESIDGLIENGECEVQMHYVPGSTTDELLNGILDTPAGENRTRICRIVYPNQKTHTFSANLKSYKPDVPIDNKMTATATWKVTGVITRGTLS